MLEEFIKQIVEETVKTTITQLSTTNKKLDDSDAMNTKQLAKHINMSTAWIYQNIDTLPHFKIGKKLVFSRAEINVYMQQKKEEKQSNLQSEVKLKEAKESKYKVV